MAKKNANGDHSIYYDERKKYWRGSIVIGYDENGKMKRKTVSGKTKTDVKQKLKQIEFGIFSGDFIDKNNVTFYCIAKQISDDKFNMNEIKANSYYTRLSTLQRLQPIADLPIQQITETQIRAFLQTELDKSASIIKKDYQMLNATFVEAIRRNIIKNNPMEYINVPKSKQTKVKVRALTIAEQSKLLDVLLHEDVKYSAQMLISMFTGLRMGEINALTTDDINLTFKKITVNKTITRDSDGKPALGDTAKTEAGERIIPIPEDIFPLISDCVKYADNVMLFLDKNDKLLTTNQVNSALQRILEKYGIVDDTQKGKISCHSLRHTYATRMIEAGVQPKVLQQLLGHTDISITLNTYCDAFEKFEKDNLEKATAYLAQNGLTIHKPKDTQKSESTDNAG